MKRVWFQGRVKVLALRLSWVALSFACCKVSIPSAFSRSIRMRWKDKFPSSRPGREGNCCGKVCNRSGFSRRLGVHWARKVLFIPAGREGNGSRLEKK